MYSGTRGVAEKPLARDKRYVEIYRRQTSEQRKQRRKGRDSHTRRIVNVAGSDSDDQHSELQRNLRTKTFQDKTWSLKVHVGRNISRLHLYRVGAFRTPPLVPVICNSSHRGRPSRRTSYLHPSNYVLPSFRRSTHTAVVSQSIFILYIMLLMYNLPVALYSGSQIAYYYSQWCSYFLRLNGWNIGCMWTISRRLPLVHSYVAILRDIHAVCIVKLELEWRKELSCWREFPADDLEVLWWAGQNSAVKWKGRRCDTLAKRPSKPYHN